MIKCCIITPAYISKHYYVLLRMHQPLNLPYKHSVYDGVPVPDFITQERMDEIKEHHVSR